MKAIRIARVRAGLSQAELGRLVDRDQSDISRIETGRNDLPVSLLKRIAAALGVPPADLLEEVDERAAA